jgi:acetyl esterase/lipase
VTLRPTPPVKGIWAIPVEVTCTESQREFIQTEAWKIVHKLGPDMEPPEAQIVDLRAEWQGVKRVPDEKAVKWTKEEQYAELATSTTDGPVILYFHGGAYILGSIETHRAFTARLAQVTDARILVLNYRLAPQHQFPAALLDAILSYKYLIDPPPGALHTAVDPSKIVISGDSAGVSAVLSRSDK